jgi:hypothetical protein
MESMLWELGLMMDLNFTALGHWERSHNIWLAYTLSIIAEMNFSVHSLVLMACRP